MKMPHSVKLFKRYIEVTTPSINDGGSHMTFCSGRCAPCKVNVHCIDQSSRIGKPVIIHPWVTRIKEEYPEYFI